MPDRPIDMFPVRLDLYFWYDSSFGSPLSRVLGVGWIQELVARLTHSPIAIHNTSTNSTLDDNSVTFPLDQSLYVDATHEVVVLHGMHSMLYSELCADVASLQSLLPST